MKISFFQDLPSPYQDHFLLHNESPLYYLHVGDPSLFITFSLYQVILGL
jgi:hypothetical protein